MENKYSSYQVVKNDVASKNQSVLKETKETKAVTNNQVLNIAFYSFLGFTLLQISFAIQAKSSAMIADSIAMLIDSLTYLCNMVAENLKSRPFSTYEMSLPLTLLHYRRKLHRLYLELFPPLISVTTLLSLTYLTFKSSIRLLLGPATEDDPEPNATIMVIFSILNLLLDAVNVFYFAKVDQAIIKPIGFDTLTEESLLISDESTTSEDDNTSTENDDEHDDQHAHLINLNMCSAWTHVFADTCRSIAVLLAGSLVYFCDNLSSTKADAAAALVVSMVIFFSCIPLFKGLLITSHEIWILKRSFMAREGSDEEVSLTCLV
jgi:Co/Zn/Cd efflux system component